MLAVPPAILDLLHLHAGTAVGLAVDNDRLIVEARTHPRYRLDELLAQCDATESTDADDRAWLEGPAIGRELI
ncbi:antitoxin [Sphingomonas sp. KR1UV-12]|uniref:Antitoxin n=1 Tax=Sphingomonas aurea TaxID=3063994 RepID=A0ABT9EKE3_9SPHN|nr:antitoxin [Sphingomonas sp. KR1UV-12]MDP1027416.1 antitoxin [Sphingomonas sp. KR1UV-12]